MGTNQEGIESVWVAGSAGSELSGVCGEGERESAAVVDDEDISLKVIRAAREKGGFGSDGVCFEPRVTHSPYKLLCNV